MEEMFAFCFEFGVKNMETNFIKRMKLMKKIFKILATVLCLAMIFVYAQFWGIVPLVSAVTYTGKCGTDLTWSLDTETGIFDITGSGEMPNWFAGSDVPWDSHRVHIKNVNVGSSVKSIGSYAFYNCNNITSICFSDSIASIGNSAFQDCDSIERVNLPVSIKSIGANSFSNCDLLTTIIIPSSLELIGSYAFVASDISDIYYAGAETKWNDIYISNGNENLKNTTIHFNSSDPMHPHIYNETITKVATCTTDGIKYFTCTCGDTYKKPILKLGHMLTHKTVKSTCKINGYEYDECLICAEKLNKSTLTLAEHFWGEWVVTIKPTKESEGTKIRKCSVCEETETSSVPIGKVNKVTINDFTVKYKDAYKIVPKVEIDENVDYTVTYTSSNPDVVTVDKNGNVTTNYRGTATVTCTVTDEFGNEVKDTCQVEVKLKWWQWIIWILLWGWLWY